MSPSPAEVVSKIKGNAGQATVASSTFAAAMLSLQAHDWVPGGVGLAGLIIGVVWHIGLRNVWSHVVNGDGAAAEPNRA
jgi:hypothetical protein